MQQEYQIKYLRAAMRDLEGIAQLYLGLAGADSAEKFIDEILHTVDLLRTFPYSGALHPDMVLAEREFRKVICRDYVCVYKVIDSEKTVYIYRIVNGKTDTLSFCINCITHKNQALFIRGWLFYAKILFIVLSGKGHPDSLFSRGSQRRQTRTRPRCDRRSYIPRRPDSAHPCRFQNGR